MSGERDKGGRVSLIPSVSSLLPTWRLRSSIRFPAVLTSTGWGLRACSVSSCEQLEQQLLPFYIQRRLQQWWQLWETTLHVVPVLSAYVADCEHLTCFFCHDVNNLASAWGSSLAGGCKAVWLYCPFQCFSPMEGRSLCAQHGVFSLTSSPAPLLLQPRNGSMISSLSWGEK